MGRAMTRTIDSHCHFWTLSRGDYGWLSPDNDDLAAIYRDFGSADLNAAAAASPVSARILVQAAPTTAETLFLLDLARQDETSTGVVGWVDLSSPDSQAEIETFSADPLFKSVRPMLQDLADPNWIASAPHPGALDALVRLGLRFDALVTPLQLDALCRFAENNGDLPIIIDHAAKPAFKAPADDPRHGMWKDGMTRLARLSNVSCKLSGLLTELPGEAVSAPQTAAAALRRHVGLLFEWFGPTRLAWGSDWPVLTLAASYAFWRQTTDLLLDDLSSNEKDAIMYGTAERFYGIEGAGR